MIVDPKVGDRVRFVGEAHTKETPLIVQEVLPYKGQLLVLLDDCWAFARDVVRVEEEVTHEPADHHS